jgi:hypothetical protein
MPRLSYRSRISVAMFIMAVLMGVLMGIGLLLLLNPSALSGVGMTYVAPTPSLVDVTNSTTQEGSQSVLSPLPRTPTALEITPASAELVPTTSQPARTVVRQQKAAAKATAQTAQVPSAPPPPTLPAPKPALAATEPLPTTGPASAEVILLQVAEAEAALRMGQLEATITYGSGQRSSARVRFDLGDEQRVPRFQITTTYTSTDGVQITERITIGDQSWQRQQEGQWTTTPARESALKQLQVFLPRSDSISNPKRVIVEGTYSLRWYDAARDADVTLILDAAGIPRQLRRLSRANGLILTVTYSGWNTPVEITRPGAT